MGGRDIEKMAAVPENLRVGLFRYLLSAVFMIHLFLLLNVPGFYWDHLAQPLARNGAKAAVAVISGAFVYSALFVLAPLLIGLVLLSVKDRKKRIAYSGLAFLPGLGVPMYWLRGADMGPIILFGLLAVSQLSALCVLLVIRRLGDKALLAMTLITLIPFPFFAYNGYYLDGSLHRRAGIETALRTIGTVSEKEAFCEGFGAETYGRKYFFQQDETYRGECLRTIMSWYRENMTYEEKVGLCSRLGQKQHPFSGYCRDIARKKDPIADLILTRP